MESEATVYASTLDMPVELGGVSIGKNKASVGVKSAKGKISPNGAEHFFVGARLQAVFYLDPNASDDVPGQQTLGGDEETPAVEAIGDINAYRSSVESISFSISFNRAAALDLAAVANRSGRIVLERIGDSGQETEEPEDEPEE